MRLITFIAPASVFIAVLAHAAVPPDIETQLKEIGRVVNPPATAKLYRPLQPNPPYKGVKVERDIKYGSDPRMLMDVFAPEKGGGKRPVLIYVSGGAGNKIEQVPGGDAFYDNIMLWAVKNGMTGVNMQRRGGQGLEWDDPGKDVGTVIQWVQQNISKFKGNPDRVFLWAHSAGNAPVAIYLSHPEFFGPKGVGLKGAVLMASPGFNIAPVPTPAFAPGPGGPGGPPKAGPPPDGKGDGKAKGRGAGPDPAVQLARSSLPGLLKLNIPIFVASGELDPPVMNEFADILKDQLCKAGHCPTVALFKDHSHMSEVFSANTADDSVTAPILKWMKGIK